MKKSSTKMGLEKKADNTVSQPADDVVDYEGNRFEDFITWTPLNRIGRAKYIVRITSIFLILTILYFAFIFLLWFTYEWFNFDNIVDYSYVVYFIAICWLSIILNNKRFHDLWKSGWYNRWFIVPLANIRFGCCLLFKAWDKEVNKYGEPCKSKKREKILAPIMYLLYVWVVAYLNFMQTEYDEKRLDAIEHDEKRFETLEQVSDAIIAYTENTWERPWWEESKNGMPLSSISLELTSAWITEVPHDPDLLKNYWLWNTVVDWEYLYMVFPYEEDETFILMARPQTEDYSNWVVCPDNKQWYIGLWTDIATLTLCESISAWDICQNSGGICTYTSDEQLRLIF